MSNKFEPIVASSALEVENLIKDNLSDNLVLFLDIDDTLIRPAARAFTSVGKNFIDYIKGNKNIYDNYEKIISTWRLNRQILLVDKNWPKIINNLKNSVKIYGLSKMDTGNFGLINSMQEWRYNELLKLGIEFSLSSELEAYDNKALAGESVFYGGIFSTGFSSKSATINSYLQLLNPNIIILVDDRLENLIDVHDFCENNNIKFIGILFKAIQFNNLSKQELEILDLQMEYLIKNEIWLEDAEIVKILNSKKN